MIDTRLHNDCDGGHCIACAEDERLRTENAQLRAALKPFADFADRHGKLPKEHVITQGSRLAKRQLTMEDCYRAADALAALKAEGRVVDETIEAAWMKGWYVARRAALDMLPLNARDYIRELEPIDAEKQADILALAARPRP